MPNDLHFPGNISEGTEASLQHGTAQMTFSRHPHIVLGGLHTLDIVLGLEQLGRNIDGLQNETCHMTT